jgi:hypothetical protein
MTMRRSTQTTETERLLPKNFPGLQERMETVKRSEKQQLTSRSLLESTTGVEKEDTFFLL